MIKSAGGSGTAPADRGRATAGPPSAAPVDAMAYDQLKNATLPRALSEVVADLADLFQKELRLAKTEISQKISTKLQASIWFVVAGVLGVLGGLVLIEALVFGIASFGIALHWSCLIVA